jgi:hypothetical protein
MTKLSNFSTEKGSKKENLPTINKSPKFELKRFFFYWPVSKEKTFNGNMEQQYSI